MATFEFELRYKLVEYLGGTISLRDLRRWFLPQVWDATQDSRLRSPLARRLELRLAEHINGHWTDEDMKELLAREVPMTASVSADLHLVLTGAHELQIAEVPQAASQVSLTVT